MNYKNLTLTFLTILFFQLVHAQHQNCGHDHVLEFLENKYPGYKEQVKQSFERAKREGTIQRNNQMVYTVPVVVHVVWKEEEENITDELIASQLEVINEDFRRLNPDAENVRNIFADVAGDPMIEFELIETIRVETTAEFSLDLTTQELPDAVKNSIDGGSDALNTEAHLNLWICKIQPITFGPLVVGQLLGYAYPPAGLDNWPVGVSAPSPDLEGVVLDYRTVGRLSPFTVDPGTGVEIQLKGRTATHEIGHYLGLRHIWGDGGDPFGGTDSCEEDDGVEDTPNTGSQAMFDCDISRNTCIDLDTINDLPDMIENFMDYSSEDCINTFTNGQIEIMRSVLENERCALVGLCETSSASDLYAETLNLFPNPANDLISIEWKEDKYSNFNISILDMSGKTLLSNINSKQINVANLDPGMYFIIGEIGGKIIQSRFVKL